MSIVVLGGGSAGWLSAAIIAAGFKAKGIWNARICVVESPHIAAVGVGEGTWPTMRKTLKLIGVSELEFLSYCDASFKQGTKFQGWATGEMDDVYYHPFSRPFAEQKCDLNSVWLAGDRRENYSSFVNPQAILCEEGLAPKHSSTDDYHFINNYGYHLDANKLSEFLKQHCIQQLNVESIVEDVSDVLTDAKGIEALMLVSGKRISADFYIDCSGMKAMLLGEALAVPMVNVQETLFVDRAIALHVPYEHTDASISGATVSTAQEAGWTWDIGLSSRRGVGYAYSSRYSSMDDAHDVLTRYVKVSLKQRGVDDSTVENTLAGLDYKSIQFMPGYRQRVWEKNCVAIGLSAGFVEPLEASSLVMVELAAQWIAERIPLANNAASAYANQFNELFEYRWRQIIDFIKLHYAISQREDSAFWRDNRAVSSMPLSLQSRLSLWAEHTPEERDFLHAEEVFPAASYRYVLYGMGFQSPRNMLLNGDSEHISQWLAEKQEALRQLRLYLPTNRSLLMS